MQSLVNVLSFHIRRFGRPESYMKVPLLKILGVELQLTVLEALGARTRIRRAHAVTWAFNLSSRVLKFRAF